MRAPVLSTCTAQFCRPFVFFFRIDANSENFKNFKFNSNFNCLLDAFVSNFAPHVHTSVFIPFFASCVYLAPFPNLFSYFLIFPLNFLFSLSQKWSQTLFMLEWLALLTRIQGDVGSIPARGIYIYIYTNFSDKSVYSTKMIVKNFQQKIIEVSIITVWKYMTRKGWKAFKWKKIALLTEKQRKAHLRFAKKYAKLEGEDWDNFLFTDECPKYLFQYPNPKKTTLYEIQEKQSAKVMGWGAMTGRGVTKLRTCYPQAKL